MSLIRESSALTPTDSRVQRWCGMSRPHGVLGGRSQDRTMSADRAASERAAHVLLSGVARRRTTHVPQ